MSAVVKGWCPGAWRPMRSGDGLILRVRPRLARLTKVQALGLSALAQRFGSGAIDLTNRANLQIRGVDDADHASLLSDLDRLGLIDPDPDLETRRNILVTPFWAYGDQTHDLALSLMARLGEFPDLPAKFGFAIDTGPAPVLLQAPADIRIERSADGQLMLRAEGAATGRPVTPANAIDQAISLAQWFVRSRGATDAGTLARQRPPTRMAQLLRDIPLPEVWGNGPAVCRTVFTGRPGPSEIGAAIGLPFGQIPASALRELVEQSGADAVRVTPWRCLILENGQPTKHPAVLTQADDALLNADACAGAPLCPSASVKTRDLARALSGKLNVSLHVSGCTKGCARAREAQVTLVGRNGRFDLVLNGAPWDEPRWRGLAPDDVIRKLT